MTTRDAGFEGYLQTAEHCGHADWALDVIDRKIISGYSWMRAFLRFLKFPVPPGTT